MRNLHVGGSKRGVAKEPVRSGKREMVKESLRPGVRDGKGAFRVERAKRAERSLDQGLRRSWAIVGPRRAGKTMGRKKLEPAVVLLQGEECGGVAFGCPGLVLAYDGESTDGRSGQGMGKFLGRKPADLGALVIPHERCSIVVGGRADEKDVHVSALVAVRVLHQVV